MNHSSVTRMLCASALLALVSTGTSGALIDRGNGLIYDSDQHLTWVQNAGLSGLLNWDNAMARAENLVFGGG
jgi:hypothetical protein